MAIKHPFLQGKWQGPRFADAAGFLFVSMKGNILILKRSQGDWAGRWASAGGWMEEGETPLYAAVRETLEEIQKLPKYTALSKMVKIHWRGTLYCTWIVLTPIEFRPKLNKEHSQFRWASPEDLRAGKYMLHDGFRDTLKKAMPEVLED